MLRAHFVDLVRSVYTEWEHGKGHQDLSGSRHYPAWCCVCCVQVQVGHVWSVWTNMHMWWGRPKDSLHYHIRHICEQGNATRGLKHPLDIPEVNDLCVLQLCHEICACLPGRHIHLLLNHWGALTQVFNKLWEAQLYLSWDKVDFYLEWMDCLSHIITNAGIHACTDKMQKIRNWWQPCNFHKSRGSSDLRNIWHILCQMSQHTHHPWWCVFTMAESLSGCCYMTNALSQSKHLHVGLPCWSQSTWTTLTWYGSSAIWVICDGSKSGVGTFYGQGLEWQTCRPCKCFLTTDGCHTIWQVYDYFWLPYYGSCIIMPCTWYSEALWASVGGL